MGVTFPAISTTDAEAGAAIIRVMERNPGESRIGEEEPRDRTAIKCRLYFKRIIIRQRVNPGLTGCKCRRRKAAPIPSKLCAPRAARPLSLSTPPLRTNC
jgi:hypothetical protein